MTKWCWRPPRSAPFCKHCTPLSKLFSKREHQTLVIESLYQAAEDVMLVSEYDNDDDAMVEASGVGTLS